MPAPGTFTLHSRAVPDLPAGVYSVHASQSISAPGATPDEMDAYVEVTAPRFFLPPDQILSTFPPNQAEGAFSSRLPQIVLKRRTLPWERELDGKLVSSGLPREIPWMALVVLADAECEFRSARPIAECVTEGVTLEGRNDATVGNAIVVTDEVVRQVFPTKEELPLLAHVRYVDLADTELALGDDDGWLAVVLANRLPQPGVRYRACLISLEGQYDVLPDSVQVESESSVAFERAFVYAEQAEIVDELTERYGGLLDGANVASGSLGNISPQPIGPTGGGARTRTDVDAWSDHSAAYAAVAGGKTGERGFIKARTAGLLGAMHTIDMSIIDPTARMYTFPVLAHWQFTCKGDRDFESLMRGLDVGLLGSLPKPPAPTQPGEKPPAPAYRPAPQVLDTGHVAQEYINRLGEPGMAWYRGPLTPRPTRREQPDAGGRLPLLHHSDQARRIGPDGRENLSLAAAFEIGRLLALAEPRVVAALLNWRKEGFEQARRQTLLEKDALLKDYGKDARLTGFADRVGYALIAGLGVDDAARMGKVRPPVDPGRLIDEIDRVDLVSLLAAGFQVPVEVVKDLMDPGVRRVGTVKPPVGRQVTDFDELARRADEELAALQDAALREAASIAGQVLREEAQRGVVRRFLDGNSEEECR